MTSSTSSKKSQSRHLGDKSSDITETFLFAKLPVQMQNDLAMAGKHDASMEEIRTFVQRRCQYAQLIPNTTSAQPFNQISAPQPNVATPQTSNVQTQQPRDAKRKFDGQCRHCGIHGHKWVECRKRLREEAQTKPQGQNQQQPTQPAQTQEIKPRYNPKLVCQICGKVGHSARDCYYRNTGTSAYRSVPSLSNRPRKTDNLEGTSNRPTVESTTPMKCPTLPTMTSKMLRKQNDTMT